MDFINTGILGCSEAYFEKALAEPVFFVDLNLDQVIACIQSERSDYDIKRYFNRLPEDVTVAKERVKMLRALENKELFSAFLKFSDQMLEARNYAVKYERAGFELQRQRFLLDCGAAYINGIETLFLAVKEFFHNKEQENISELLSGLLSALAVYTKEQKYQTLCALTKELSAEFAKLRVQVEIARDRVKITQEVSQENYSDTLKRLFPAQKGREEFLENPFQAAKEPGEFEKLVLAVFCKNNPELFAKLKQYEKNFSKQVNLQETAILPWQARDAHEYRNGFAQAFLEEWILTLERQAQVYLAFRMFAERTAATGYPLVYPEFLNWQDADVSYAKNRMEVADGYDLALLLKSVYSKQKVVCNDAYYRAKEAFFVVTGPNQGGKTTYARSVGQAVYFSLMGLAAPCRRISLPFFYGILTHFSVEESLETGRGKLKEELVRLEPMMHTEEKRKFVVINELFTTAATYDGYIMGKRVMEHFMSQGCLGIYVTHIQELADEKNIGSEENSIVSLSACVDQKNASVRTFQIIRKPAEGIGYAYGLVEKYHLTYPELKERLKELNK